MPVTKDNLSNINGSFQSSAYPIDPIRRGQNDAGLAPRHEKPVAIGDAGQTCWSSRTLPLPCNAVRWHDRLGEQLGPLGKLADNSRPVRRYTEVNRADVDVSQQVNRHDRIDRSGERAPGQEGEMLSQASVPGHSAVATDGVAVGGRLGIIGGPSIRPRRRD